MTTNKIGFETSGGMDVRNFSEVGLGVFLARAWALSNTFDLAVGHAEQARRAAHVAQINGGKAAELAMESAGYAERLAARI